MKGLAGGQLQVGVVVDGHLLGLLLETGQCEDGVGGAVLKVSAECLFELGAGPAQCVGRGFVAVGASGFPTSDALSSRPG